MCICIVNCRPSENQKKWANLSSHKGLSYSYSDTLSTPIRSCRSPQIEDTDTRIHSNTASCFQSLIYLQDRALECLCECGTVSVIYKYIHSPPPPARYYCYFQYCPGFHSSTATIQHIFCSSISIRQTKETRNQC